MIEILAGAIILIAAYSFGSDTNKKSDTDIQSCAIACDSMKSYDSKRKRCICK